MRMISESKLAIGSNVLCPLSTPLPDIRREKCAYVR